MLSILVLCYIDLPLQQSNIQIEDDMYGRFDSGIVNKKSRQAIIDAFLNKKASLDYDYMQQIKETADNHMDNVNHSSIYFLHSELI